ncbi:hypothetical protein K438DRAFT_1764337 [Mycena galopus ATCC 62051]|nr:hypothetical protein K438DRAFT_1764337 [Mycena galopus ATCC 62051]
MGGDLWIIRCTESGLAPGYSYIKISQGIIERGVDGAAATDDICLGGIEGRVWRRGQSPWAIAEDLQGRGGRGWGGAQQGFVCAKWWTLKVAPVAMSINTVLGDAEVAVVGVHGVHAVVQSMLPSFAAHMPHREASLPGGELGGTPTRKIFADALGT